MKMKKIIFCAFVAIIFITCGKNDTIFENSTPSERWQIMQDDYIVPDADISNERILPNVISEQEVLLKAAEFAIEEGALDPTYYAYENNPALMTAKIEKPILLTDAESGVPDTYMLNAVDSDGISLARITVSSSRDVGDESFIIGRSISETVTAHNHIITQQEARELIKSQFPDKKTSEPLAIHNLHLENDPQSHKAVLWYFTTDENARGVEINSEEYVIDAAIYGYRFVNGGVTNRAAINQEHTGPFLNGYRMAKLNKPLRLFDKLNAMRAAGGVTTFNVPLYSINTVSFTPVPLK
jgi:hypothetical protein